MSYNPRTKCYSPKAADAQNSWILIDATDMVVGRLASEIAKILRGKHKARFTPHFDFGDNVVVINADKVRFTGKKLKDKIYYWHTGYPGGIKERNMEKILSGQHPHRVLERAVKNMLPKESPLARKQLKRLYLYNSPEHPHTAQQPVKLDLASVNSKNKR